MFESLSEKLQDTFKQLTGRGTLSEANIEDAMRQVRLALLDADVNFKIVKDFIAEVRAECLGEKVLRSVSPGQQAIKIVHDHLVTLMASPDTAPLELKGAPAVIMMIGLHGSGKTTSSGKLASFLKRKGKRPLLVAADVYRPAAMDQLAILGQQIGVPVFVQRDSRDVVAIGEAARQQARRDGNDILILDTAGRLQIDQDLVQELVKLKQAVQPQEILLVADAALGQEAVSVAEHFNTALGVTGIILTKLDGDARGGAALSMRKVTGRPIRFIGLGEKIEDFDEFHADRMASRILGMGDVVSLVEKAAQSISEAEAERLEQRMMKNQFDLNDFLTQLQQLKKLGGFSAVLSMIPGGQQMTKGMDTEVAGKQLTHIEAVIRSMTAYERSHPECLGLLSRRQRIAKGAGRPLLEVQQLLKRFETMRDMMSKFGKVAKTMNANGGVPPRPGAGFGGGGALQQRPLSRKELKAKRKKGRR